MADLITDEMLDTYAVTATYDKLRDALVARYDGLLDRTALYQPYQPSLDDPRLPAADPARSILVMSPVHLRGAR